MSRFPAYWLWPFCWSVECVRRHEEDLKGNVSGISVTLRPGFEGSLRLTPALHCLTKCEGIQAKTYDGVPVSCVIKYAPYTPSALTPDPVNSPLSQPYLLHVFPPGAGGVWCDETTALLTRRAIRMLRLIYPPSRARNRVLARLLTRISSSGHYSYWRLLRSEERWEQFEQSATKRGHSVGVKGSSSGSVRSL